MCYAIACPTCGRATYAGCGQHVEEVLGHLPASELCRCHLDTTEPSTGSEDLVSP